MFGRPPDPLKQFAGQVQRALDQQNKRINEIQARSNALSQHVAVQHSHREVDRTMEELQRREEHYAQVVMLAGYAGFFTLWVQTRAEMSLWMFASTGALILYKSWRMGRFFSRVTPRDVRDVNNEITEINKHWPLVFLVSSGTGVLAGLSLLLWFVYTTIVAAARLAGAA